MAEDSAQPSYVTDEIVRQTHVAEERQRVESYENIEVPGLILI